MFSLLRNKFSKIKSQVRDRGLEVEKVEPTAKEKVKAAFKGEIVIDEKKLDELFRDFELALLKGDVALEVSEKIVADLKQELYGKKFKRGKDLDKVVEGALKTSLREILIPVEKNLIDLIEEKGSKPFKPFIIAFVGVNGTGKTTTIAKIVRYLERHGFSSVLAASDTYRAGAIDQLEKHAEKLGIKMIKHEKGADPAAVAFDAIKHAEARGKDVVMIDTAGRMETNINLMDEMKKIVRVSKPDLVLFIGDALTGNAAIDQARNFDSSVPIDGVILTKADADAKGGSAISISYIIEKPIFFLGTGQGYDDLIEFDPEWFINELLKG
ncbi:MAG: signal recognition particle-docking protein FtsY [Candidatus Hydrothermarchaeaceae archaeon]